MKLFKLRDGNHTNQKFNGCAWPLVVLALGCFAISPTAQAIVPAPDGGYPGGNTAEGQAALLSLTTGGYNTAVGFFSLRTNTIGDFNTAIGAGTLLANTSDENTATGAGALLSNTTGSDNTANGAFALFSNTTGVHNTATGLQALLSNTTGSENTAIGLDALAFNTTGMWNTAMGSNALFSSTTGAGNTSIGFNALAGNTTGVGNVAVGFNALSNNTTGVDNIAVGDSAGMNVTTGTSVICIGAAGSNSDSSCYIGNIFGAVVDPATGVPVYVDTNGKLGVFFSSRRFKHDVRPMDRASESILALKPVTFRYKKQIDTKGVQQFGLAAEDVAKVNPDLVINDRDGKPLMVRYEAVNAMLLNEFLKEHRKVEKLEAMIAQQHKDFEAALTDLKGQIQKVSAQLELSRPAPQTVKNDQ